MTTTSVEPPRTLTQLIRNVLEAARTGVLLRRDFWTAENMLRHFGSKTPDLCWLDKSEGKIPNNPVTGNHYLWGIDLEGQLTHDPENVMAVNFSVDIAESRDKCCCHLFIHDKFVDSTWEAVRDAIGVPMRESYDPPPPILYDPLEPMPPLPEPPTHPKAWRNFQVRIANEHGTTTVIFSTGLDGQVYSIYIVLETMK